MSLRQHPHANGPATIAGPDHPTAGGTARARLYEFDPDQAVRPRRRYAEVIGVPLVLLFLVIFVKNLFTNPNWQWNVVGEYLFNPLVLEGVRRTIVLTLLTGVTGTLFGLLLASMRLSSSWLFRGLAVTFIGFMR
jgi:hypothetical protein